ncbi:unnamed protein product, partial [Rotaria sp. Silwood2]
MFNNINDDFIPETPKEFIFVRAVELARTNVNAAMDSIRDAMPSDFSKNRQKFVEFKYILSFLLHDCVVLSNLKALNQIFVREQEEKMNRLEHLIFKPYDRPESFPDCTL